ncbi:Ig-like domain-containing protein [Marinobacter goseongensis]|uniref:Ig-like domain-containing protein n=1 Tax=Marinobacter goseongensis TaxID=453838 RepID=UPI002004925D|nr:Ig-like domain-containing protein [Marinobacter goseongensis]MCK7553003.1 Ig-like domain-containing protein [Marinobacter goseongensis]
MMYRSRGCKHPSPSQLTHSSCKTLLTLALTVAGLAGCGGDKQSISDTDRSAGELYFSYPAANQAAVPVTAPMFMRFTRELTMDESELAPDMLQLQSDQGDVVTLTDVTMTSGQRGIAARPAEPLKPGTRYTLTNQGLSTRMGDIKLPGGGISFTTAPANNGPLLDRTEGSNGFRVARFIPTGDDIYPATDMSALRIQFTEPLDESSLRYGETISLLNADGEPVPAQMYVQGHRVTVDPEEDLDPEQTYTISLTTDIRSTIAEAPLELPPEAPWTFRPLDSTSPKGERERMAQKATTDTGKLALSNETYNSVKLSSLLLGSNNATTATGTVFAELGFIPRFDKAGQSVPLRIDRGALMTGSDVAVNVAGELPAGFSSGAIQVRFLSDATGFLMSNPYTDNENSPRLVELYIDMALNTENTIANAALGQQLMHVHLVGTALVENGTLTIEAVGVIEPDVMGVDVASGLISFRLEGYRNPDDAPPEASFADSDAPTIKSWVPGEDNQDKLRPGDPVIVYFSEPLLPGSVNADSVKLYKDGVEQTASHSLNGSALVVTPAQPLEHGADYSLLLNGMTDLAGHEVAAPQLDFALPPTLEGTSAAQSPIALTTLPGFPCTKTAVNTASGHQGRCAGGKTSDDLLPIPAHPNNRAVSVRFSQNMDPASISVGDSLTFESFQDGSWTPVPTSDYVVNTGPRHLTVMPVLGWTEGTLYRYTLNANTPLRSQSGLPLQTEILTQGTRSQSNRTFGGQPMVNYFTGAAPQTDRVALPLRNLPAADANADLDYQSGLEAGSVSGESVANAAGLRAAGVSAINDETLVQGANIGCAVGLNCEQNQFIYLSAMLDTLVTGDTEEDGSIPVDILPSILATTSSSVWAFIDTSFVDLFPDFVLSVDLEENEEIATGPMLMRIRYAENEQGDFVPPGGKILTNNNGELTFATTLDVYLDAPFLNPSIGPANLGHNLRSYPINGLELRGPITFLDDGRMQIALENLNPVPIDVEVTGEIEITSENTSGICGSILFSWLCEGIANSAIDANTRIHLEIPAGKLRLNYISPYTQN